MRRAVLLFCLLCLLLSGCAPALLPSGPPPSAAIGETGVPSWALLPSVDPKGNPVVPILTPMWTEGRPTPVPPFPELDISVSFIPFTTPPLLLPRPTDTPVPPPPLSVDWSIVGELLPRDFDLYGSGVLPDAEEALWAWLYEVYEEAGETHMFIGGREWQGIEEAELERLQKDERACVNINGSLYTFVDINRIQLDGRPLGHVVGGLVRPQYRSADSVITIDKIACWVERYNDKLWLTTTDGCMHNIGVDTQARTLRLRDDAAIYITAGASEDASYIKLTVDVYLPLLLAGRSSFWGGYDQSPVLPRGENNTFGVVGDDIVYIVMSW